MAGPLHPLLLRQLRHVGLAPDAAGEIDAALPQLLERVSRAYTESDQDRYMLERSQEISSREMTQLYSDLKASQARLASLVSLSSDWVWEQDAQLRFTYVSKHDNELGFGLSELLVGRRAEPDPAVISETDANAYVARFSERKAFRNLTFSVPHGDGRTSYFRISGEPVFEGEDFRGYRGVGSDVTLATLAELRVLQLARYDSLTGLANRGKFLAELDLALARARHGGQGLAVLFIDLDRFKTVNDSLGHDAGDKLLQVMAQRLLHLVRGVDTVARLGGDEFVLLVDGVADEEALSNVARRVLTVLCEPLMLEDRVVQLSASVGIGVYPRDGDDVARLLKSADSAMYLAKSRGKNNFQFFTAQIAQRTERFLALEADLREAVERGQMRLHFQPRYAVADGRMSGMEALVRWQHPQRGLLGPGEFIDLAEETGLIVPIGRWVVATACAQVSAWRRTGYDPPPCSINLSVRQFGNETLVEELRCALAESRLEPAALELELTESMLMTEPDRAQQILERLHALGLGIAIDDFGTGHSSLAYLKRFPAHTLKLDRSFVMGLPADRDDRAISQAVIAMAHSLDMRVVAEGVETVDQLDYLRRHGCDEVQGFLLARPMPPEQLVAHLAAPRTHTGATRPAALHAPAVAG